MRSVAHAPFAREVDLEHVAGAKIFVNPGNAVEESRRRVLIDVRFGMQRRDCRALFRGIGRQRVEQFRPIVLDHEPRRSALVIDDDRGGTAQRERSRLRIARRARQLQLRLDLARKLVAEIDDPAAAERQLALARPRDARALPRRVERAEERSPDARAAGIAHAAVAIEPDLVVRKCEQDVVARARRAARHAFEQRGVACRKCSRERQQVARTG
jgi:hypothetical protein